MSARGFQFVAVGFLISTCGCISPAIANDDSVYEDLAGVQIGAVFFSPAQRAELDRKRQGKSTGAMRSGKPRSGKLVPSNAAGYIIKDSGEVQVYVDGNFVSASDAKRVVFPGDIQITKTVSSAVPHVTQEDDELETGLANEKD